MSSKSKKTILIFTDYYLPGYKAGGPIRSVQNLVESLGDEFKIKIFTRDRDFGSNITYEHIRRNTWNRVGKAEIYYAAPDQLTYKGIKKVLSSTNYDLLYLNSLFSAKFSIIPLLLNRTNRIKNQAILIAPRGELSEGALELKKFKKKCFLLFAKWIGLHKNLFWQASADDEANDIKSIFNKIKNSRIFVAPNLLNANSDDEILDSQNRLYDSDSDKLKLIFISRITRKKNLIYLLKLLKNINRSCILSIFGPKEDKDYWDQCVSIMDSLPRNIEVEYQGELKPDQVRSMFKQHDLFVFPTLGENFGHVIFESLVSGTPVLLSDTTPWRSDRTGTGAVNVFSLAEPKKWIKVIENWPKDQNLLDELRKAANHYAKNYLSESRSVEKNREMFHSVINKDNRN